MQIRYLSRNEIDAHKWDACISAAINPLLYAKSFYLDAMCPRWSALVMNDYEAVMPLPWNRKWGIYYLFSPYFVIGGGLFAPQITAGMLAHFVSAIPARFWYVDLDLNEHNYLPSAFTLSGITPHNRTNTLLKLDKAYEDLYARYSSSARRKLKKAASLNFELSTGVPASRIIALYSQHYKEKDSVIGRYNFSRMIGWLEGEGKPYTKTYVLKFKNGEVCAFYLLLYDENYVYWLMGGSTDKGKKENAFYYLTDCIIRQFAASGKTFRFEGSDHPGIAFFNRQFGGQTVQYPHLTINRLPWPLRYLKRG